MATTMQYGKHFLALSALCLFLLRWTCSPPREVGLESFEAHSRLSILWQQGLGRMGDRRPGGGQQAHSICVSSMIHTVLLLPFRTLNVRRSYDHGIQTFDTANVRRSAYTLCCDKSGTDSCFGYAHC